MFQFSSLHLSLSLYFGQHYCRIFSYHKPNSEIETKNFDDYQLFALDFKLELNFE
jgi:hypothetical protein